MNLKNKLPKWNLKTIGINERTNIINKKKDKTLIMDNLSKKSFNLIILIHPFNYLSNLIFSFIIYKFKRT